MSVAAPYGAPSGCKFDSRLRLYSIGDGISNSKSDRTVAMNDDSIRPSMDEQQLKMSVLEWLSGLGLGNYSDKFRTRGYDNIQMVSLLRLIFVKFYRSMNLESPMMISTIWELLIHCIGNIVICFITGNVDVS